MYRCQRTFKVPLDSRWVSRLRRSAVRGLKGLLPLTILLGAPPGCQPGGAGSHRPKELVFQVTSNSMAPALIGPHYPSQCLDCGQAWIIAAETRSDSRPVVCPTCHGLNCRVDPLVPGQPVAVTVDASPKRRQRWECVVFTSPESADPARPWQCKRIWGLPGETLHFASGDLWIDGRRYHKKLDELLRFAIPVSRFPGDSISHWYLRRDAKPTPIEGLVADRVSGFTLGAGERLEWLYHHPWGEIRRGNSPTDLADTGLLWPASCQAVPDDYPYNQATSRHLVAVDDLLLTIEFGVLAAGSDERSSTAELDVLLTYQGQKFAMRCAFDSAGGQPVDRLKTAQGSLPTAVCNPRRLAIGGWDGMAWIQIDHRSPVRPLPVAATEVSGEAERPPTSFALHGLSGRIRIVGLRIDRDLYLRTNERDVGNEAERYRIGRDEYFVLGDNLPISDDSRRQLGNLPADRIIGTLRGR